MKLEIDVDCVGSAAGQCGWWRINLQHAIRRRHHRVIHHNVPARSDNFDVRDLAVGFNANLKGANERFGRVENRSRLIPLTVKTIMDECVIPAELRRPSAATALAGGSAARGSGASCHRLGDLDCWSWRGTGSRRLFAFRRLSDLGLLLGELAGLGLFLGEAAGFGVGFGAGLGVGFGVDFGVGFGVGVALGVGVGVALGGGEGSSGIVSSSGVGSGVGGGVGSGVGSGVGGGVGSGVGSAVSLLVSIHGRLRKRARIHPDDIASGASDVPARKNRAKRRDEQDVKGGDKNQIPPEMRVTHESNQEESSSSAKKTPSERSGLFAPAAPPSRRVITPTRPIPTRLRTSITSMNF